MSLAEASEARKARLQALRRRKEEGAGADEPILKHRNFDPESRQAKKRATKADADGDAVMDDTVEKSVAGLAERIVAEDEERRAQELDVFNIAPKRANWDLKRDMEKKLARLERRTQEAIHTLIRQRLAAQKGQSDDIVGAMNSQAKDEQLSDEDD
ncbi:mRNA splicing factor [Schizophyllum commune H4-8]|uniref:mRNA splicing factor n=1 Tax=Schizophyllum commune (strain H4-8 / FGSC 9210) TaxID=578458 RepID=D8PSW3_SCHCM|nr:mRNA splicing factor [Schizophyllum commune H4-8]KAI5899533.1 mRNA splicing factor [Schizophyllum commune H4-8]